MDQIFEQQKLLTQHPVYETLTDRKALQRFMRYHVFAVWDFMSLLKALQRELTCVQVPWRPSKYPAGVVRLINQIVLGEESDLDLDGRPGSHFELYLRAMEEVGASTAEIRDFVSTLDLARVPPGAREFVGHNLNLALHGSAVEVAASFFFGREKLIPQMFERIVSVLRAEELEAPTFLYYLERHIEVDAEDHGPLALKCLEELTGNDDGLRRLAERAGVEALRQRRRLWDRVAETEPGT